MPELKDYSIMDIEAIDDERYEKEKAAGKWVPESRVYLKSEADKVLADKDKELRHEKYRRCKAKAEACMHKRWRTDEGFDYARSTRHMHKWLELAEKFEEEK